MDGSNYKVSIIIVCMNNLNYLNTCLDSIKRYTSVSFECFVVAYLFSKENMEALCANYPWVTIIESNEIRGFSENNNLALREAKGDYCFVINDDTYINTPIVDVLCSNLDTLPSNVAVISPNIKYPDGRDQFCGRPPMGFRWEVRSILGLKSKPNYKYENKNGIFESYNLMGGAFMIRTEVFRNCGFFDEFYFFCPEDVALSTLLNKKGYKCYVNADAVLYHVQGQSISRTKEATLPAEYIGRISFFSDGDVIKRRILQALYILRCYVKVIFLRLSNSKDKKIKQITINANLNCISAIRHKLTPKEAFVKYYKKK